MNRLRCWPIWYVVLCASTPIQLWGQTPGASESPEVTNAAKKEEPTEPSGVVVVKGQVTDPAGAGIAGVQVSLKAKSDGGGGESAICETVTDEMGDFTLRSKKRLGGTFLVSLSKDQYAAFTRELELQTEGSPPFVGETLEGNLSLHGRVVDGRNEQPIAQATIEISATYRDWNVETNDEGRFDVSGLPPGSAQVTVDASGFARQKIEVKSIVDAPELLVVLRPQRIVRLKIQDETGRPLPDVQIELIELKQNDSRTAVSDKEGRAEFSGISADAEMAVARLSCAGYLSSDSFDRSIRLPKDEVESEHLQTMVQEATISGVIRDENGKAINGARVIVGKDYSLRSARAWTNAEGKYTIGRLSQGPNILTVHRSEFAPELRIVEAKRGEATVADFSLTRGRTVTGVVKDERGTLMKSMEVVTTNWRGYLTLGLRAMTDEEGRFELNDAPKDEFTISAQAPPTTSVNLQVAPGATDVVVTVPYVPEFDKGVQGVHIKVGAPAPPVTLRTADQEVIEIHKLTGKTVLFIFWTSWCPSCKSEVPNHFKLYEKYKDRTDFIMLGINRDEKEADYRKAMEEYKLPWKQVHGHENGTTLLAREFGAFAYPTGYVIGPDGKMAGTYLIGKQIDDLLYQLLIKPQRVRIEPPKKE